MGHLAPSCPTSALCAYVFFFISFSLQTTKKPAGHFVIHPDWCSEKVDTPQFEGRPYRPWSYEFQGARTYKPQGNKTHSTAGVRRVQSAPASRATISVNNCSGSASQSHTTLGHKQEQPLLRVRHRKHVTAR